MPDLYNVIFDVRHTVMKDELLAYDVRYRGNDRWDVYIDTPSGTRSAKLEFIIRWDGEDNDVTACVLRNGDVGRRRINLIMDSIMERL